MFSIIGADISHKDYVNRFLTHVSPHELIEAQYFSNHAPWILVEIMIKFFHFLHVKLSLIDSNSFDEKLVVRCAEKELSALTSITVGFLFD